MNRLRKVVETALSGGKTGRVAYVLKPEKLPAAHAGFEWRDDASFNAAEAVLAEPGLNEDFSAAIKNGCAVVSPGRS